MHYAVFQDVKNLCTFVFILKRSTEIVEQNIVVRFFIPFEMNIHDDVKLHLYNPDPIYSSEVFLSRRYEELQACNIQALSARPFVCLIPCGYKAHDFVSRTRLITRNDWQTMPECYTPFV